MSVEGILKNQLEDIEVELKDCERDLSQICDEARGLVQEDNNDKLIATIDSIDRRIKAVVATRESLLVKKSDYQYLLNHSNS